MRETDAVSIYGNSLCFIEFLQVSYSPTCSASIYEQSALPASSAKGAIAIPVFAAGQDDKGVESKKSNNWRGKLTVICKAERSNQIT